MPEQHEQLLRSRRAAGWPGRHALPPGRVHRHRRRAVRLRRKSWGLGGGDPGVGEPAADDDGVCRPRRMCAAACWSQGARHGEPGVHGVGADRPGGLPRDRDDRRRPVYDATPNTNAGKCVAAGVDRERRADLQYQQPCRRSETVDLTLSTTGLRTASTSCGSSSDAAQNMQTVLRQTISTDNRTTASATLTSGRPSRAQAAQGRTRGRRPGVRDGPRCADPTARARRAARLAALGVDAVGHAAKQRRHSGTRRDRDAARPQRRRQHGEVLASTRSDDSGRFPRRRRGGRRGS